MLPLALQYPQTVHQYTWGSAILLEMQIEKSPTLEESLEELFTFVRVDFKPIPPIPNLYSFQPLEQDLVSITWLITARGLTNVVIG